MKWDWLSGHPVLLFGFIMLVLGVPTTIAGNWQLVRSAVHRVRRTKSPNLSELNALLKKAARADEAIGKAPAPSRPSLSADQGAMVPRVRLRPDYRYNGGAVSTAAVVDLDGYMESMTSQPDSDHVLSLSALFRPDLNGTGIAFRS